MDPNTEECFDVLGLGTIDNTLLKRRASVYFCDETDSGICGSEYNSTGNDFPTASRESRCNVNTPVIMINEDEIDDNIDNIEMATIESCDQRMLTPEGNVKYKNYRILAPAPAQLRMYSPSGDIHTSPKKGKIVPKFDLFHDSLCPRDKLLSLINSDHIASKELESIIRPPGLSRRIIEILRKTNKSSLDDKIEFLNNVLSPSPSSFSVYSEDSVLTDIQRTPSPENEEESKTGLLYKSFSVDIDDHHIIQPKRNIIKRQITFHTHDDDAYQMNLCDELKLAEDMTPSSYTPRRMTDFEYSYFHRPASALSHKFTNTSDLPRESKKSIIRNFIQRNMMDRPDNRDKLAKLALAIEEDSESESTIIVSSARQLEDKITIMLDEVKTWKTELMEIQEDIQDDDRKVAIMLSDAKILLTELRSTNYLDDMIYLLKGNLDAVAKYKTWPFTGYVDGKRKKPESNLIV